VDSQAISGCLDAGNIAIVSPVGYSPTGEVFNLSMEDVAVATAAALRADKLVFLSDAPVEDKEGELLPELTAQELRSCWDAAIGSPMTPTVPRPCARGGARRRAARPRHKPQGAGLAAGRAVHARGLWHHDHSDKVVKLRSAGIDDAGGILKLIEPLEEDGTLVRRGRELLEREITRFSVIEHDGVIVGCAALYPFNSARAGELACLAVRPDYRDAATESGWCGRSKARRAPAR